MPTSDVTKVDGSFDFSGGVNSLKATTVQSAANPNGLARNELSWLMNATVRGGGIMQRTTWLFLMKVIDSTGFFQGGYVYEPDYANPYLVLVVSGRVLKVDVDTLTVQDLSAAFGLTLSATAKQCWICQAEMFLILQAGDYGAGGTVTPGVTDGAGNTLPLFWDDTTLRRSKGITNTAVAPGTQGVNEIPAATAMDYYMGRLWYATGRTYSAGDIVGGPSGSLAYRQRDAVLNVTENPLVVGGDGFTVPTNAGHIRALKHNANLDTALGQGQLFIFTRKAIYSLTVPVTRTDWIAANSNNQPRQSVVQITNGSVNDRSVVAVNGDLFYQSLEPSIRSLFMAIRYFNQWGNVATSSNVNRMMRYNDRGLLYAGSGIVFDNRILETALPKSTNQGVIHEALAPLDFTPLSTLGEQLPPCWEGAWSGLDILQLFAGDFGGRERAFALAVSKSDQSIVLWEMNDATRFEGEDKRVDWVIEFPAFTWSNVGWELDLKKLVSAKLWADKVLGEVIFNMEYRPDGDVCWHKWHEWKICTARNSCEDEENPVCYPLTEYRESFRGGMTLPLPPIECQPQSNRPVNIGYQFQCKLSVKGWARIRGLLLVAEQVNQSLYSDPVC